MASAQPNCKICNGTGWQFYTAHVEGYPLEVEYVRACPKCSGQWRSDDRTGVPDEFHEADLQKFNFGAYSEYAAGLERLAGSMLTDWADWENAGKGLYLWSTTPGSGKTFLSCCIAKSVMMKYGLQMRFIAAPDYINLVAESYRRERWEYDPSEVYRTCQLLVFDDIGTQLDKEWQRKEIFQLVNHRMASGCVTIYTSNLPVEKLNIDDRTKSRIERDSIVVKMPEENIRRKIAAGEQERFLRKIQKG